MQCFHWKYQNFSVWITIIIIFHLASIFVLCLYDIISEKIINHLRQHSNLIFGCIAQTRLAHCALNTRCPSSTNLVPDYTCKNEFYFILLSYTRRFIYFVLLFILFYLLSCFWTVIDHDSCSIIINNNIDEKDLPSCQQDGRNKTIVLNPWFE